MTVTLLIGDVRERLRELPDESVHCAVTSPPYFGLRDYGCDGQIGLEPTPDDYVAEMVAVFREVRRVLRSDGTLWLNLGDSYANAPSGARNAERWPKQSRSVGSTDSIDKRGFGLASKQRLMIPARTAIALQEDGWWLRDEIIWRKPNPMPYSGKDRTTPAHEMLYTLTKADRYHYNIDAIKERSVSKPQERRRMNGVSVEDQGRIANKQYRVGNRQYTGFNERYASATANCGVSEFRQPRSVWDISPQPFHGAHFATFPPELPRRCILAGCPVGGMVLDPFFGAGTTGVVADELGRNAIGVELNPEYAAIALDRIAATQSKQYEAMATRAAGIQARIRERLAA